MVMKTYFKNVRRLFKKHCSKMFSILFILLISIGLLSGLGASIPKVENSVEEYYINNNVSDLIIKSKRVTGFNKEEIARLEELYGQENIMIGTSFDIENNKEVLRYYYLDLEDNKINKIELLEGKMPTNNFEVLVERETSELKKYKLGDKITYNNSEYKIVGIVKNPLYFQKLEEPSYLEDKNLEAIVYLPRVDYLPINDIYITFENRELLDEMSDDYKKVVKTEKEKIKSIVNDVEILSLYENVSFFKIFTLTDKITLIWLVLFAGFLLVSSLVTLSTMTRLIEEERSSIACFKTLGYSNKYIIFKYLSFAFLSTVTGGILAYFGGIMLTNLIYYNFNAYFNMPIMTDKVSNFYYILTFLILVVTTLLVTLFSCIIITNEKPSELLRPKPPKNGKKIIIEHIPLIWSRLSFKYKSTCRNLFRYKKHFFMTVVAIAGSTVLIFLGLGLFSYSLTDELLGVALAFICLLILIFAACLTALVIYTLTNINISERHREIATLMVLGYGDREVCGYIYREIYIMSIIGIIFGVPLGYLCLRWVFDILEFGSINDISYLVYVFTPLLAIIFTILVCLFLKRKIIKVNMNDALKTVE